MAANLSIEHKKGEVNELKASLRNPAIERDPEKRREVVKRVIAYMTLGIDVSRLFTEMIMATSSKDLVIKKMVYLYICNYATTNPELSLLAINTLQKDCRDEDPMTRGLALRSFCSLRLPNIVEYLQKPVEDGLVDPSAYVRKTAAMGCVKLHNLAPALVVEGGLQAKLRLALYDKDTSVIASAICALEEMEGRSSVVTKQLVHHLLNRMRDFSEWAQVIVLGLLARYSTSDAAETFDIMNLLEERLKHSNAAVVLATTKVFLRLTADFPAVHQQVYARLRTPLVTLVHGGSVEQGYVTLKHIALLAQREPGVFAEEHRLFFCRFNEPGYTKLVKLEILTAVATPRNVSEILQEVAEYATDVDEALSRAAVSVIGRLGAKVPAASRSVAETLVAFLQSGMPHVCAEAVVAVQLLVRSLPQLLDGPQSELADGARGSSALAHAIGSFSRFVAEPEARTALLWLVGQHGELIPEAPYLLEPMIDEFHDESSGAVRLELLSATVKLFLKRPAEMQAMTGRLLEAAVADTRWTEVHDRAMAYYRLLLTDVRAAQRVLGRLPELPQPSAGHEAAGASEWQDELFEELNSLSVVLGQPAHLFLKPALSACANARALAATEAEAGSAAAVGGAALGARRAQAGTGAAEPAPGSESEESASESASESESESEPGAEAASAGAAGPAPGSGLQDLLGELGLALGGGAAEPGQPWPELSARAQLDSAGFQSLWGSVAASSSWQLPFSGSPSAQAVVSALALQHVKCMAFGTLGQSHKFYFYAQQLQPQDAGPIFLVELVLDLAASSARATLKSTLESALPAFIDRLRQLVHAALL